MSRPPALPLSPDRYIWMSDDGMTMRPDQDITHALSECLKENESFKPFMDFLGKVDPASPAPKIAREWFSGSGLVEESENEGRSIRPLVDLLGPENLFAGFQKILRKMPSPEEGEDHMRESEIHNLTMVMAKSLLPDMHRAFDEITKGARKEGVENSAAAASSVERKTEAGEILTASGREDAAISRTVAPESRYMPPEDEDEDPEDGAEPVHRDAPEISARAMGHDIPVPTVRPGRHDRYIGQEMTVPEGGVSPEPEDSISLLPPPPATGSHEQNMAWITGKPWSPYVFGIEMEREDLTVDEMMDLETEAHGNFMAFRSKSPHAHAVAFGNTTAFADFLDRAGQTIGSDTTRDHGRRALAQSYDRVIERILPDTLPDLVRLRARLIVPDELAALATIAFDIAEAHVGDGFGDGEQRFEGSINGNARVTAESVIDRAVFIHMVMGTPMPEAMVDGLIELYGAKDYHLNGNDALGLSQWEKYFYDEFGGAPELTETIREEEPDESGFDMSF